MARKKLVVMGARGFGRECVSHFRLWNGFLDQYEIKGFLDNDPNALTGFSDYPEIIGSVEDYMPEPDDLFVCAFGNVPPRRELIGVIEAKGGKFETLIAPDAFVCSNAIIGRGALIFGCTQVSANAKLGDYVLLHRYVNVGHDVVVGDCSVLESYSFCGGFVNVGEAATLHTRATILPGVKVGDGAVVGAGSVVIMNVRPGEKVFGNPAKKFRL